MLSPVSFINVDSQHVEYIRQVECVRYSQKGSQPMLVLLKFTEQTIKSYGWGIILLAKLTPLSTV